MTQKLKDKVAVITGGTTGIGFAAAKRFVDEGAKVILTGTNPKTLETARSELGGKADVIASDASKEQDVKALFKEVVDKHGAIDVLFLNAGIAKFAPWEQHTEDDFDRQFAINVKGPWLAIKHAIPVLADGASVIATTSVANKTGMAGASAYSATNGAPAAGSCRGHRAFTPWYSCKRSKPRSDRDTDLREDGHARRADARDGCGHAESDPAGALRQVRRGCERCPVFGER